MSWLSKAQARAAIAAPLAGSAWIKANVDISRYRISPIQMTERRSS
ncbi:MAG: hypothetical protein HY549_02560 [Elusimicrobia bacterium]|nr:hypothetical protein [Elusimicrobiota bacterium]